MFIDNARFLSFHAKTSKTKRTLRRAFEFEMRVSRIKNEIYVIPVSISRTVAL